MHLYNCLFSCMLTLLPASLAASTFRRRGGKPKEGEVKLVGRNVPNIGTVLIYHKHRWGAVCDDEWDIKDAKVVCRQLGYTKTLRAVTKSRYGRGRKRIWMAAVRCGGDEEKLEQCVFRGWGRRTAGRCLGRRRSAGVLCLPKTITTPPPSPTTTASTATPTTTTTTTTTTPTTTTTTTTTAIPTTTSSTTEMPTTTNNVFSDIESENISTSKNSSLSREIDELVKGLNDIKKIASKDKSLQADAPVAQGVQIRMLGGRYSWEGRLEVKEEGGVWGAICGAEWSLREAMVACRELGQNHGKQALQVNYFGGENLDKIFHKITCTGRENRLEECEKTRIAHNVACPKKTLVAGVVCTDYLPDLMPDLDALKESLLLQDRHLYYLRCAMEENCLSESAYIIRNTSKNWHSAVRRLMKFSTIVHNRGRTDFLPYKAKANWEWHSCHMHFHSMEVFAHYDIIDEHGNRLAQGSKASFCLEDSTCDPGVMPKFNCRGYGDQGLSVNCSDNYMNDIDCQWIDITGFKPGQYTFKLEINPNLLVAELDYDNNVAVCDLWYSSYNAGLSNCRFESLL